MKTVTVTTKDQTHTIKCTSQPWLDRNFLICKTKSGSVNFATKTVLQYTIVDD